MTSDSLHASEPTKLNDRRVSTSLMAQHHQRHYLHHKRAATVDPETNEEKLRIVVLGATKVGKSTGLSSS